MGVDITSELCIFVASIISGMLSGILYDFFTVFTIKSKKLFVSLSDILLSFVICVLIVAVFYFYNSFDLRWYMFIGLFLGIILYFLCLSNIFVFCLTKIMKLFAFIFKILLTPTLFLYKILVVYLFKPVSACAVFLGRKLADKFKNSRISRGIKRYERRNKKKYKKKKTKNINNSYSSGCFSNVNKGCYVPTPNN